ncbi:glycosyltransferase family 2 protein [Danxiaibacter flavus]|uniref:Glycosyltransferase family 2 protein n=1 Tax=Danxiaibacter flavus TaxID=3049108 RepID=A0ABV3ZM68_9BACT|nr:glycosyltransferase family 2 protein [Chitinophagaceae bacterium DXS]
MNTTIPYNITHFDTAEDMYRACQPPLIQNEYRIFWWKNMPLCHLCLDLQVKYTEEDIKESAFSRIINTLKSNFDSSISTEADYKSIWKNEQQEEWNNLLSPLLAKKTGGLFEPRDISVVICTRNRAGFLRNCLKELTQQVYAPLEIIVVDNAPSDTSSKETTADFPLVRYIAEPTPGLDFARNAGAKTAKGKIIAYTDDDVNLHPLWTYYIAQAFASEEIYGVTGLVFPAELKTQAQRLFEEHWSFNRGYVFKKYDNVYFHEHLESGVPVWNIGAGANMAFRRDIFDKVGYFDERLDAGAAGCNGDSEFWYRILAEGYSMVYTPLAIAFHTHRQEMEAFKSQIYYYMRGFTVALHIQHERYGHKGNLDHLYKHLFPYYFKKMPRMLKAALRNPSATHFQEIKGIISGIRYYKKTKHAKP